MAESSAERETLSNCWSRDSNYVYSCGSRIRNADLLTFKVLNEHYAIDSKSVYTPKGRVASAHLQSFRTVGPVFHRFNVSNAYAADDHAVYHTEFLYKARVLKNADPDEFHALSQGYGCDAQSVYWGWRRLPAASPSNWEFRGGSHSTSGRKAYCFAKKIKGANAESLITLPIIDVHDYWCRSNSDYYQGDSLADVRDYLTQYKDCFIFVGRVANFEIFGEQRKRISRDDPERWSNAKRVLVDVTTDHWIQQPDLPLANPIEAAQPIRFGEGIWVSALKDESWAEGERIWILKPFRYSEADPFDLMITQNWHESSCISNLDLVSELVAASRDYA